MDVLDPELLALVQEALRLGILERPATRAVSPFGRVELDALEAVALGVFLELLEARVAITGVPAAVDYQPVRILLGHPCVALGRIEPLGVPLLQVGRQEHADVDVAILEDILDEVLLRVLLELLDRPVRVGRAEPLIRVEALDPALGELLLALHP